MVARSLPMRVGQRLLRVAVLAHQPVERLGELQRVQVLALHVLDERELERSLGVTSFTTTKSSRSPARCAARQRRSPAMIS